jgi:hypothetical protein
MLAARTGSGVTEYRLYLYESARRLSDVTLICLDDDEAKTRALERAKGRQGALWRDSIFVASWPAKSPSRRP